MKSGNLNFLEPSGPLQVCNGTDLPLPLLTHSMEQSPSWEANWFLAGQEIPCILWNQKVHYCILKCKPTVPILSQTDPVRIPTLNILKIHLNIILSSRPGSPSWFISLRLPHQNRFYTSRFLSSIRTTWPTHFILLDFITRTISGEWYISLSSSCCSFLHPHVTSSLLSPNILLKTYSQTPSADETYIGSITTMEDVAELSYQFENNPILRVLGRW